MQSEIIEIIEKLRDEIRQHEYHYYVEAVPVIGDKEFDDLMLKLQILEKQYPDLITKDSPTLRVGSAIASFDTVKHRVAMMSIENSYSKNGVSEWVSKMEKISGCSIFPIVAELKIDGVSGSFGYKDGQLINGATRGTGLKGDLITENVRAIRSLPLKISSDIDMDVRGEIYTPRSVLKRLNEQREIKGEELFKNCRNLTTGAIKSLDPIITSQRGLQVMVYGIAQALELKFAFHSEVLNFLEKQGFKVNHAWEVCNSIESIFSFIDRIAEQKSKFDFDIDGIVLKVDSLALQVELGETPKTPRWAIAYKYPQERAITKLLHVEWQIGRSQLTPVAHLSPIELCGTTVSRASLHNIDQIKEKDIRLHDYVILEKAGYIIPYIVAPVKEKRDGSQQEIMIPIDCPVCSQPLLIDDESSSTTQIRCINDLCQGVLARRVTHLITQLEIENFGPQLVEQLIKNYIVKNVEDVFDLTRLQIASLERRGDKSAEKIIASIINASKKSLGKLISALGIANTGIIISEKIAEYFKYSLSDFMTATVDDFVKIDGISTKIANSIVEFNSSPLNENLLCCFKKWWEGPDDIDMAKMDAGNTLAGKSFVVTGESIMPRKQIESVIKSYNGKVRSSVSKTTDYLLVGSKENESFISGKKDKAKQFKVTIIDEFKLGEILGVAIVNGRFEDLL